VNYYTSDLHLGDPGIVKYQSCGLFKSVKERDETIIKNFNDVVGRKDDVYILGDVVSHSKKPIEEYLKRLNGNKHLIVGNHDVDLLKDRKLRTYFDSITYFHYIRESGYTLVLCHYPLLEWSGYHKKTLHLYGHIHNRKTEEILENEETFLKAYQNGRALNVCTMMNNYRPVTLKELIKNNEEFYQYLKEKEEKKDAFAGSN